MASTETVDGTGAAVGVPVRLGKYTLLARLASGGMGEVYVAQMAGAAGFEKQVVIKRILPQLAQDEHFVQMFLEEARITAQLNHPNVCQVFELGEIGGEYYLAMEYLEGLPISKLLEEYAPGGVENLRIVAGLMIQACEGLAHAHEFTDTARQIDGIVHRDVSPQNLFVTTAGLIKVLDFGVAKLYREGSKTVTNSAKGKYLYMSPEQVQGEPVDRRSDIFSLGVVLFEILTGRNLFRRPTEFQTLQSIITGDRPRLAEFRSDVPQAVNDVVERALSVSRGQRYASARTLAEALTRAVAPLGGPASISELAEFVRREHTTDITAQRERIRRASAQMRVVDITSDVFDLNRGPGRGSSPHLARAGSHSGIRPSSVRASTALDEMPDEEIPSAAGRRRSSVLSVVDEIDIERDDSGTDTAGQVTSLQSRRYARWGLLVGIALALVALWSGRYLLERQGQAASPSPAVAGPVASALPPALAADHRDEQDHASTADDVPANAGDEDTAVAAHTQQQDLAGADDEIAGGSAGTPGADDTPAGEGDAEAGEGEAGEEDTSSASGGDTATAEAGASDDEKARKHKKHERTRQRRLRRAHESRGSDERDDDQGAGDDQEGKAGYLTIDSSPYAEIFVDGRKIGITPLVRIPLSAGRHVVRAVAASGDVKKLTIRVKSGEIQSRRVRFPDMRN